jgi:hypothetical protein
VLFLNEVRLSAREVMLRIVKLQRSEVCFASVVAHLTSLCGKAAMLRYAVGITSRTIANSQS